MSGELSYNFSGIEGSAGFNDSALDFKAMEAAASRTGPELAPAIGEIDTSGLALSLPAMTLACVIDSRAEAGAFAPEARSADGQFAQQGSQSIQQMAQQGQQGTQSGDDVNIGVGELQECTISKSMDGASGRQMDSFVVTFDRPVDPSAPEFDALGRLLIGTDGGIWSGGGDDLLIGGRTTWEAIEAGTQLASVTDLVIDPFDSNAGHWEMHEILIANQDDLGMHATVDIAGVPATLAEYALLL